MDRLGDNELASKILNVGAWDIAVKITAGLATAGTAAGFIALPTDRETEERALSMFNKPLTQLSLQEKQVAEFAAGRTKWNNFFQTKVYPYTRKLPGAQNPILNPYRDSAPFQAAQDDDE
ncbi:hypothetical protein QJQ45_005306 [Haematococcus lacustris]|nr:hypothetical protein QJQ45_005306 [Haematococcus lacustris]